MTKLVGVKAFKQMIVTILPLKPLVVGLALLSRHPKRVYYSFMKVPFKRSIVLLILVEFKKKNVCVISTFKKAIQFVHKWPF